jgi:hypothetical protein
MWLHSLDVCRVNSYIIAKEKGSYKEQKDFVLDWILALNHRAQFVETARTRTAVALFASPAEKRKEIENVCKESRTAIVSLARRSFTARCGLGKGAEKMYVLQVGARP